MRKEKIEELIKNNERKINFLKAKLIYLERNKDINGKEIRKIKGTIKDCEWRISKLKKMIE